MAPMVVAGTLAMTGAAVAAADSETTMVPLQNKIRACDFVPAQFLDGFGTGYGSAVAHIGTPASGTVSADVQIQTSQPDTAYQVRLIQLPRPASSTCGAGDPGIATGVLHTDGAGNGSTTVSGPKSSGATAAWVVIEGPPVPGKTDGEVYSTDYPARLN
ncbi:hypothetical protein M1247_14265 [Mycobacterium sp. 21AC1]|uniref:hypothetical protein n=1 Tax=[Mycobacterium] appelbergii TaxID=2939269 RepID=UPI0029395385|nr:hypothetical protein [Mycobacterium sp. 21AC1]MDV3126089.1 hypothetical protein [Mycobacterium sp. 21AC1]